MSQDRWHGSPEKAIFNLRTLCNGARVWIKVDRIFHSIGAAVDHRGTLKMDSFKRQFSAGAERADMQWNNYFLHAWRHSRFIVKGHTCSWSLCIAAPFILIKACGVVQDSNISMQVLPTQVANGLFHCCWRHYRNVERPVHWMRMRWVQKASGTRQPWESATWLVHFVWPFPRLAWYACRGRSECSPPDRGKST